MIREDEATIPRLPMDSFGWLRWIHNDIWHELGVACREKSMFNKADTLRRYAVGYCPSERLICKPKRNEVAVMFLINDRFSWTHLREHEFKQVFCVR